MFTCSSARYRAVWAVHHDARRLRARS